VNAIRSIGSANTKLGVAKRVGGDDQSIQGARARYGLSRMKPPTRFVS
jgi:hypothetical protein